MPVQPFDLHGRVAIVTGSTKGIGRAMVQGLAEAGASVVVSSRKQELCDQVAAEVAASTGAEALGLACHVGEWDAIPGFVDAVVERFGRIDVLVNNAGITPAREGPADIALAVWRKIFSVNVEGPLRTSQVCAPIMRERGGGSIVNIATVGAYAGGPGVAAYGSSKAALINLTMLARSLRWQAFLTPIAKAKLSNIFAATSVGFGAIFVIGRAGEIVRPAVLSLRERLRPSATIATILIERVYDTTAVAKSDDPTESRTMPSLNIVRPRSWPRNTIQGRSATASTISGVTETSSSSPRNHHTHLPG